MRLTYRFFTVAIAAGLAGGALGTVPAAALAGPLTAVAGPVAAVAAPKPAAWYKVNAKSGLKVWTAPTIKAAQITLLKHGTVVASTGATKPGWIQIKLPTGGKTAWAPTASLVKSAPPPKPPKIGVARVTANGVISRSGPGTGFKVVGTHNAGVLLATSGRTDKGWTQVFLSTGGAAWVSSKYLAKTTGKVYKVTAKPSLGIWSGPGAHFKQVGTLKYGVFVPGTGKIEGKWVQLTLFSGAVVWAPLRYLSPLTGVGNLTAAGDAAAAPEGTPNPGAAQQPATDGPAGQDQQSGQTTDQEGGKPAAEPGGQNKESDQ